MPANVNPVGLNSTWFEKSQAGGTLMSATGQQFLNQTQYLLQWLWASGPTTSYPTNPVLGQMYYDTTLAATVECTNPGSPTTGVAPTWATIGGGGGSGTVTSITATAPVVVTPSPLTTTGVISHAASGVAASTYGDSTHVAQFTVEIDGHVTAASSVAIAAGKLQSQQFTGSGTFTVPAGVTGLWITIVAGGGAGGGSIAAASAGGGGGAGEAAFSVPYAVTALSVYTVTIGNGGTAVTGANGGAGTNTLFDILQVIGGLGGLLGTTGTGGKGGGVGGGAGGTHANPGNPGVVGVPESSLYFGGAGGGGGGSAVGANGGAGGGSGGYLGGSAGSTATSQAGGGGGAATIYGSGGVGGNGGSSGTNATAAVYGSGGGGSGGLTGSAIGGNGAPGYCLVQWIA